MAADEPSAAEAATKDGSGVFDAEARRREESAENAKEIIHRRDAEAVEKDQRKAKQSAGMWWASCIPSGFESAEKTKRIVAAECNSACRIQSCPTVDRANICRFVAAAPDSSLTAAH